MACAAIFGYQTTVEHLSWHIFLGPVSRSSRSICESIKVLISHDIQHATFKAPPPTQQQAIMDSFDFTLKVCRSRLKLVRWIPPLDGFCLNVDGASKGNLGISGGGGCVRNSQGDILLAFAFNYGFGKSLQVEVRALHDGLLLVEENGLRVSLTYSDSAILVRSFNSNSPPGWECQRWWQSASDLIHKHGFIISHVFREANQVVDALASYPCTGVDNK
ncbi:hypothetical protein Taro_048160, partial [Colocasia esculenta]|nr:hypothetical protein [Colocasia esculenta]